MAITTQDSAPKPKGAKFALIQSKPASTVAIIDKTMRPVLRVFLFMFVHLPSSYLIRQNTRTPYQQF